jgi:hypothetical protein
MAITDNCVGYWKFDESSGNAVDSSGNGNTLTNNNSTAFVSGKINNAADLELSSSNYFSITDGAQTGLDLSSSLGASFWITPESQPGLGEQRIIFSKFLSSGDQRSYSLRYKNIVGVYKLILLINEDGILSEDYTYTQTLSNATTYHIVVNWSAAINTAEIFINGSSLGTIVGFSNSIYNSTASFIVGNSENLGASEYWDGWIDELGIWSRTLTSGEIATLYNSGSGYQLFGLLN